MQPMPWPEPAPEVAAAIRAIYRGKRQVPLPVRVRDELGEVFADAAFAGAFGKEGRPGWSPGRLALITVLQRVDNLTDRQAAEAVATDLTWKYALGLSLDDPGFDASVLSEFRSRVIAHELEEKPLDLLLSALQERGLLAAGGKQRTDSTHVISAVRDVNRVELAGECVRAALEALAVAAPGWVRQVLEVPGWADRYELRADSWRMPTSKSKQEELARVYGADGYALLEAVYAPFSPAWLRHLPAVDTLRIMLIQHYVRSTDRRGRQVIKRRQDLNQGGEGLPPGRYRLASPYDLDTRWAAKGSELMWNGYKVHISETCHRGANTHDIVAEAGGTDLVTGSDTRLPNLITNVATTDATVPDTAMTEVIHQHLARRGLLPAEHYLDAGYSSAELIVQARELHQMALITPLRSDNSVQARTRNGYDRTAFTIDWEHRQVTCPQGQTSTSWTPCRQKQQPMIVAAFPLSTCRPCPVRALCTSAQRSGRHLTLHPRAIQETLDTARAEQTTPAWHDQYALRCGIEATIHQAATVTGLRRARYRGIKKVHLQHVVSAIAVNLIRLNAWWNGHPLERKRTSHLAQLEPALAA
ncbi:IS1182 family transposase [Nonomuraea angiospora]|uniref:IS1182 family transposase n=1 Tax=Nonomuraea angiospora TaxID=46172 RepID=UPI00344C0502